MTPANASSSDAKRPERRLVVGEVAHAVEQHERADAGDDEREQQGERVEPEGQRDAERGIHGTNSTTGRAGEHAGQPGEQQHEDRGRQSAMTAKTRRPSSLVASGVRSATAANAARLAIIHPPRARTRSVQPFYRATLRLFRSALSNLDKFAAKLISSRHGQQSATRTRRTRVRLPRSSSAGTTSSRRSRAAPTPRTRHRTEQSMIITGLRGVGKTVLLGQFGEIARSSRLGGRRDRGEQARRHAVPAGDVLPAQVRAPPALAARALDGPRPTRGGGAERLRGLRRPEGHVQRLVGHPAGRGAGRSRRPLDGPDRCVRRARRGGRGAATRRRAADRRGAVPRTVPARGADPGRAQDGPAQTADHLRRRGAAADRRARRATRSRTPSGCSRSP